jgi:hypothetical protein
MPKNTGVYMAYIVIIISGIIFLIIFMILSKAEIYEPIGQSYNDIRQWDDNENPEFKKTIIQAFHRIMEEGTGSSFIIVEFNNEYYIRYKPFKKNKKLFCETVSNDHLSDKYKISSVRELKLIKTGFKPPVINDKEKNIPPNYTKFYNAENLSHYNSIYDELVFIMTNVYKIDNGKGIVIKISIYQQPEID